MVLLLARLRFGAKHSVYIVLEVCSKCARSVIALGTKCLTSVYKIFFGNEDIMTLKSHWLRKVLDKLAIVEVSLDTHWVISSYAINNKLFEMPRGKAACTLDTYESGFKIVAWKQIATETITCELCKRVIKRRITPDYQTFLADVFST